MPIWVEVENSISVFAEFATAKQLTVDNNCLFDEIACLKNYCTEENLADWRDKTVSTGDKWVEVFTTLRSRNILLPNLELLVSFAMSLPGTNASIESIFSLMNNTWSDEMSRLSIDTLKARLVIK